MCIINKIIIVFFSLLMLVGFPFVYAANEDEEPIKLYLKSITPSSVSESSGSSDKTRYELALKIANRNLAGTVRIRHIELTPDLDKEIEVVSTDISKCGLLKPSKSCQATVTVLTEAHDINSVTPIVDYAIDEPGHTSRGTLSSNISLDESIKIVASTINGSNSANIADNDLDFTSSHSTLTFKNSSESSIKITKIYLESGRATASNYEPCGELDAGASCKVNMTLNWSGGWFNFFDKSDKDDYIVIDYEDAWGEAKEVFIPLKTFIKGNKVFWVVVSAVVVVAIVVTVAAVVIMAQKNNQHIDLLALPAEPPMINPIGQRMPGEVQITSNPLLHHPAAQALQPASPHIDPPVQDPPPVPRIDPPAHIDLPPPPPPQKFGNIIAGTRFSYDNQGHFRCGGAFAKIDDVLQVPGVMDLIGKVGFAHNAGGFYRVANRQDTVPLKTVVAALRRAKLW